MIAVRNGRRKICAVQKPVEIYARMLLKVLRINVENLWPELHSYAESSIQYGCVLLEFYGTGRKAVHLETVS